MVLSRKRSREKHAPTDYPIVNESELQERERKYTRRIEDVQICNGLVQDGRARYNYLMGEKHKIIRWEKYLKCDGLPKPWCPQEIRSFMVRLRNFEHENLAKTMDWTLAVIEDSILTQDIFQVDLTRKKLKKEICPNLGEYYDKHVAQCLLAIQEIDQLLDDDYEFSLIDLPRSKDIVDLKTELESEIRGALDRLTYRLVAAKDTYLQTVDGLETTYSYKGNDFTISIWALRDVPVRCDQLEWPMMIARMPGIGVDVQIPLSCLSEKLTLRCIHTSFDHFSPQAKTYEQIITIPADDIVAGIPDIVEALISEWVMQMNIMDEERAKMKAAHAWYEEVLIQIAQKEAEQKTASKQEGAKKVKVPRPPKEPPAIEEGMYPDTFSLFREREKMQFEKFLNDFYHPERLKLLPGQINLKKYIISGGIYSLFYVSPPKHTDYKHFNVTSHENCRKLIILKDIVADLNYFESSEESEGDVRSIATTRSKSVLVSRIDLAHTRAQANIVEDKKGAFEYQTEPEDVPYFFVTLQLPGHLCRWEWPRVCQYEESEAEVEELQELNMALVPRPPRPSSIKPSHNFHSSHQVNFSNNLDAEIKDENLKITNSEMIIQPKVNLKRYTSNQRLVGSTNILSTRLSRLLKNSLLPEKPFTANVNQMQPKNQIRVLERYCVPRIISSFKFPVEIREVQNEIDANKSKGSFFGNKMLRTEATVAQPKDTNSDNAKFSFENQDNPERVYPIFGDEVEDYITYNDLAGKGYDEEIKQLINCFDDIRDKYVLSPKKILKQNEFSIGKVHEKKKIDQTVDTKSLNIKTSASHKKFQKLSRSTSHLGSMLKLTEQQTPQVDFFEELNNLNIEDFTLQPKRLFGSTKSEAEKPKHFKKVYHWTVNYIFDTKIDQTNMTVTVKTDRLGVFGLAFNRYAHFPFRDWSLRPNDLNPDELIFTLDTFHARIVLNITTQGFTGYVTDLQKQFVSKPTKYLTIDEPITEFKELKKRFLEKNINIFPEPDATFYIKNGYFSEKHLATEIHLYETIAVKCMHLKFYHSRWNRLATRRDLIVCFQNAKEKDDSSASTVHVTPEDAKFVEIRELCSDHLEIFKLEYTPTWRNINFCADMHQLINSMSSQFNEGRNENPMILVFVLTLLTAIRPLSYG